MTIAIVDQNECNFGIKFEDESLKEKVKEYMQEGLAIWYMAAHDPEEIEENKYFTKEEILAFYGSGYAEPTMELLTKDGIQFECIDLEYDDDGEVINVDEVI